MIVYYATIYSTREHVLKRELPILKSLKAVGIISTKKKLNIGLKSTLYENNKLFCSVKSNKFDDYFLKIIRRIYLQPAQNSVIHNL